MLKLFEKYEVVAFRFLEHWLWFFLFSESQGLMIVRLESY